MSFRSQSALVEPPPEHTVNDGPCLAVLDRAPESEWLQSEDSEDAAPSDAERVLILEDDPTFREVIEDFLVERGYAVKAVQSGVEGIQQVLASDFAVILCDMMMPGLPGDLFYRAVERARPKLCERFIFMTGFRGDARANDFISSVGGSVLTKPFPLDALLDAVCTMETRRRFAEWAAARTAITGNQLVADPAPAPPPLAMPRPEPQRVFSREPIPFPPAPAHFRAPEPRRETPIAKPEPVRPERARVRPSVRPIERPRLRSIAAAFFALAVAAVFAAVAGSWWSALRQHASSSAELLALETHWTRLSQQVADAEQTRRGFDVLAGLPKRIMADRDAPRWTPALRSVAMAAGAGIELQGVQVGGETDATGARELQIDGVATGESPRVIADRFRQTLEAELKQRFSGKPITARFERIEDEPDASPALPGQRRTSFTIITASGNDAAPEPEQKPAR